MDIRILRILKCLKIKADQKWFEKTITCEAIPIIIAQSGIDEDKPIHQITKEDRARLVDNIKSPQLTFRKFRPIEEAIVTSGCISTKEINSSTMESKDSTWIVFCWGNNRCGWIDWRL